MTGREETKIKLDNSTKKVLKDQPKVLSEYFAYLCNNGRDSARTRSVFIGGAIRFSKWLLENGIMTYRIENWNKITPAMINRYLLEIGMDVKPKTKADYYIQLKSLFEFLSNMEYIDRSPFEAKKIPKQKYSYEDHIVYLTEEEIEMVRQFIRDNETEYALLYETMFTLAFKTGIRVSALTEINLDDININNKSIRVTDKENYTRDVYVGEKTMELIERYYRYRKNLPTNLEAFFVVRRTKYSTEYVRMPYQKYRRKLAEHSKCTGKHITPHKLRDTCAMTTYEKYHDIYLTSEVLGHKSIENTKKYTKVTEERRREVADFLDDI